MANFVRVTATSELAPGQCTTVECGGRTLALYNVDGKFYATDNTCKHRGGPLGEGELDGNKITCPWHGWQYDVTTGACEMNPSVKVDTFSVQVEGGDVKVAVD